MVTHVVMPKFTENMTEGTILSWVLDEGEAVVSGDVLAKIETDIAVLDLEAVGSGFLRHILANEGATVKAGTEVAIIGDLDDDIGTAVKGSMKRHNIEKGNPRKSKAPATPISKTKEGKELPTVIRNSHDNTMPASSSQSQLQERFALHANDDLPGIIVKPAAIGVEPSHQEATLAETSVREVHELKAVENILDASNSPEQAPEIEKADVPLPNNDTTSHFNLTAEIHMAEAERLREQMIEIQGIPLSLTTLYVRAAALAFSRNEKFHVSCLGESQGNIDVGIALMIEDRFLAPILHNCSQKNVAELSKEVQELTHQARVNPAMLREDADALFTICNFGMYPIEQFIPVLSASQKATLAFGTIRSVQICENGSLTIDRRMTVTLSCDDKSLEEDQAALFLQTFKQILERPLEMFLPNPVE